MGSLEKGRWHRPRLDVFGPVAQLPTTKNVFSPNEALTSTTFVHALAFVNCPLCVKTAARIAAGSILRTTSFAGIDSNITYQGGTATAVCLLGECMILVNDTQLSK